MTILDDSASSVPGTVRYRPRTDALSLFWIESPSFDSASVVMSDNFADTLDRHLQLVSPANRMHALWSVKLAPVTNETSAIETRSSNSSDDIGAEARQYYDQVETRLNQLSSIDDEGHATFEQGAIKSALSVLQQLKQKNYSPPDLSWHSGDAIVMLWKLGDTTYAMTITDGELGYVVRRNRKAVRMDDSISLSAFRLEDLR